ncbi:hypothetical protein Y032_0013g2006 [Ancylostoma ceylanicum]|nr:hypothetical protein Y032_0013g2006 [Ancylostoma ceylanicum]
MHLSTFVYAVFCFVVATVVQGHTNCEILADADRYRIDHDVPEGLRYDCYMQELATEVLNKGNEELGWPNIVITAESENRDELFEQALKLWNKKTGELDKPDTDTIYGCSIDGDEDKDKIACVFDSL